MVLQFFSEKCVFWKDIASTNIILFHINISENIHVSDKGLVALIYTVHVLSPWNFTWKVKIGAYIDPYSLKGQLRMKVQVGRSPRTKRGTPCRWWSSSWYIFHHNYSCWTSWKDLMEYIYCYRFYMNNSSTYMVYIS